MIKLRKQIKKFVFLHNIKSYFRVDNQVRFQQIYAIKINGKYNLNYFQVK